MSHAVFVLVVSVFEPERMDMSGEITQQGKTNVDQQIRSTSLDKKHPKGRNKDLKSGHPGEGHTVMRTTQIAERTMIAEITAQRNNHAQRPRYLYEFQPPRNGSLFVASVGHKVR